MKEITNNTVAEAEGSVLLFPDPTIVYDPE
jgi:hypothetical protein